MLFPFQKNYSISPLRSIIRHVLIRISLLRYVIKNRCWWPYSLHNLLVSLLLLALLAFLVRYNFPGYKFIGYFSPVKITLYGALSIMFLSF